MHSPLSMQDDAHWREALGPSPVRAMSSTPVMMSCGFTSAIPAGPTRGQTSTHLPHFVQASSERSTRSHRALSKEMSSIRRSSAGHVDLERLAHNCCSVNGSPQPSGSRVNVFYWPCVTSNCRSKRRSQQPRCEYVCLERISLIWMGIHNCWN